MPRPLTGLTGLSFASIDPQPQADPIEMQGGPVDPGHSGQGLQPGPFPYDIPQWGTEVMGPYGTDSMLVAEEETFPTFGAGSVTQTGDPEFDYTPYQTHAAPWPRDPFGDGSMSPENTARQLIQSAAIHAVKTNASGKMIYASGLYPGNDEWVEYQSTTPGTSLQPEGVPQSVGTTVGGFGSRDVVNSRAPQNQYGFDSAHLHRRVRTGGVEGNFMWMKPGSRPLVRNLPGAMRLPVGQVSPFAGQNVQEAYAPGAGVLTEIPPDYTAVPQPLTQALPQIDGGPQPGFEEWS